MPTPRDRVKKLTFGGALLAALAASSCCWVPLVLGALGLGGAFAVALGTYRPYAATLAALLLAAGFAFMRETPRGAEPDACGCAPAREEKAARAMGWLWGAIVVLVAVAPSALAPWAARRPATDAPDHLVEAVVSVRGIDCEACALPLSAALGKLGGFHDLRLDVAAQTATVRYEPAPARLEAYVAAINDLGYEAALPDGRGSNR
ncbi:heavy-metal-associated domain-containing protein [Pendulispora albinea]|uniref:Mercuric transport protein MerT n=1 Tax=Pendulispora albinea TaxID=2741071 RepID=A0ABZ2MBC8_9BACT